MLRGSSRHDGIPNKQSAKDRDRDRQREQQRKERAQMLPDEKEIHASAQDLFHAPVKVKPSIEDTTAVQIQNTLGSFDTVRHLMIDGTHRKLANLVGVDQGLPGTPVAPHRLPSHSVEPPPYRPPSSGGLTSSVGSEQNSTKSHYQRNLYPANHHTSGINNSSQSTTTTTTSNTGNTLFANSFRTSTTNPNPPNLVQKVPHSHNQLPPHNTNLFSVNTNPTAPVPPNAVPILNTKSPGLSNTNTQVRSKPNISYGHSNAISGSGVDVSVDGLSGSSISDKNSSVFNDETTHNNSASAPNDKSSKNSSTNKKPALERADSQLELESILKEMIDVTPPLTAIQTPIKENFSTKKLPQRRSSKSEEKIVQSIIDSGMAKVPSPIKRMDTSAESSSSYETDESTDSETEDSSSGSQNGGDKSENAAPQLSVVPSTSSPTPRWDLASFITKNDISTKSTLDFGGKTGSAKSPKDGKSRDSNSYSSIDSETSPGEVLPNPEPSVTSTSVFNKSQSASPLENISASNSNLANHTKVPGRSRAAANTRPESHIPPRKVPPSIPTKGQSSSKSKISSLTASSSDEEVVEKQKKVVVPKPTVLEEKKASTGGAVPRKRPRQSSTASGRHAPKSDGDSSPENNPSKTKKGFQDRNKSDTIRKLFRPARPSNWNKDKKESPSALESEASKANNGTTNSTSGVVKPSSATSNRISAKDSGRKSNSSSVVHNGDLDSSATYVGASDSGSKKKEGPKEKESSHGKKHPKQQHAANSHSKSTLSSPGTGGNVPSASLARVKDETSSKSNSAPSSLIIRIPLDKLRRKPPTAAGASLSAPTIFPSVSKNDKELEKTSKLAVVGASNINNTDSYRLKVLHNSSRVGSSSDPSNQPFAPHDPCISRDRDDPTCSDSERLSLKNHSGKKRPRKKSRSSPKKSKIKREPDSRTKAEEDLACGEVSSNVLGYAPCDSVSVTTTRTPPIESDVVQAPDSSLNPPHLPSPVIPPQVVYYSYFEKFDHKDDLFSRDQDSYLQEAKKLKHSADGERTSTAQASMYLEAGLYFILTGILMERDNNLGSLITSNAPYTMYKDTLSLIQYIGSRWRSRLENHDSLEAKIIVLSMRCQALLSLKLFKMKMKETKEMVQYMQDYFLRAPPRDPSTISSSPQLSTPSPRSPTSSPASGISVLQHTPSPHHPHQNHHVTPIPRSLYAQIHKHCSNTFHVISAHDTWEQADGIVAKHRVEEFFIGIDRQFGPLTLHSSLVDLVRYVRQGIQLINAS